MPTLVAAALCPIRAGGAVLLSIGELVLVSAVIRGRHRVARSALGRLYGFCYDIFASIHGVIAMGLQRTFAGGPCHPLSAVRCPPPPVCCTCNPWAAEEHTVATTFSTKLMAA